MRVKKSQIIVTIICAVVTVLAFLADKLPFFKSVVEERTLVGTFLSSEYFLSLRPLLYIVCFAVMGIIACIVIRNTVMKNVPDKYMLSKARTSRTSGKGAGRSRSLFSIVRWTIMVISSILLIFGGLIFGMTVSAIDIPVLSCPWNTEQMVESSCYYLAHLTDLFKLPLMDIIVFFFTTLLAIILLGRVICGFMCPMGLIQDLMDKIRQGRKIEAFTMNERRYKLLKPVKWTLLLLMIGLSFAGGSFCNFCPAIAVSPVLAGVSVSLYVSGFVMILVLIGSFFKKRAWCNVCPLGYLIGLLQKISLFRIKKDCQACTECGACYEACPMGIKIIYTEREKTDVTEANCIMCGQCIKKCPEDNGLSMTFAGMKIYSASRKNVMKGYETSNFSHKGGRK